MTHPGNNLQKDRERTRRFVRRNFSAGLMSDTKWRRLFSALEDVDIGIRQFVVKFVENEDPKTMKMPALHPPWAFVDTIEFGPVELCAIEWLEIPAVAVYPRSNKVPAARELQDVEAAEALINELGQYPLEKTETGLRIIGYSR